MCVCIYWKFEQPTTNHAHSTTGGQPEITSSFIYFFFLPSFIKAIYGFFLINYHSCAILRQYTKRHVIINIRAENHTYAPMRFIVDAYRNNNNITIYSIDIRKSYFKYYQIVMMLTRVTSMYVLRVPILYMYENVHT